MGSYYQNLFASTEARSFLLIINQHDDAGIASLGEDGKPQSWCFGSLVETLSSSLKTKYPYAEIDLNDNINPKCLGSNAGWVCDTALQAVDILNGKSRNKKYCVLEYIVTHTNKLSMVIGYDEETEKYVLLKPKEEKKKEEKK
jgi:hypothetical protein